MEIKLIPLENVTPELVNEAATFIVPTWFFAEVGACIAQSRANELFDSLESFACLRVGYVLACMMQQKKSS